MEWLNQNSEALQVLATFVLVVVTISYVVLIHRQLEASGRPSLNVFIGHANMETSLEIENVGPGPAFNIKLEPNRDFTVGKYKSWHDIGVIKNGIARLGPTQRVVVLLTFSATQQVGFGEDRFEIAVRYESQTGKKYNDHLWVDTITGEGMF